MQTEIYVYEPETLIPCTTINSLIESLNADPSHDPSSGLFAEYIGNGVVRISDDQDYIDLPEVSANNILQCSLPIDWDLLYTSADIDSEPTAPDAIFFEIWKKFESAAAKMQDLEADTGLFRIKEFLEAETTYEDFHIAA